MQAELFGSLGATGHGHGSGRAVLLGLAGESPETVDTDTVGPRVERIRAERRLNLLGAHEIDFDPDRDLVLHRRRSLPYHPNGMTFAAYDGAGPSCAAAPTTRSVAGSWWTRRRPGRTGSSRTAHAVRYPFLTGAELLDVTTRTGLSISEVMLANERVLAQRGGHPGRPAGDLAGDAGVRGARLRARRRTPGGLKVRRRAAELRRGLEAEAGSADPLHAMDWVTLFALAVNEENAAGGRVVTAPTNGAAGIIPAVLHYYTRFVPGADDEGVVRFLLTAGAIGVLFKENASISGAEVGCQGEVGSACSMAAAGLAEALGGTPEQVENAAEIGMEHNLGLTCDPVGGLVQIPCIERNAVASIKAITAARLALRGDGVHKVSLDKVIKTMRETGADMKVKYKETARGGLAVNVIEC